MFFTIYWNELKRHLSGISFYIFFFVLFLITCFFAANLDTGAYIMGMSIAKESHNAPIVISRFSTTLTAVGVLFAMILMGRSVTRDFSVRIHDFFFTVPMSKATYLGGRFLGSLTATVLLYLGVFLGFVAGCAVIAPSYYGPFRVMAFVLPWVTMIIPNTLLMGVVFFSMATLSRKMKTTYLSGIAFLMIYGLVQGAFTAWDNDAAKCLLDPFGIATLSTMTRYWTVADMNANLQPAGGLLLWNRLIWLTVGLAVLLYTWRRFRFVSVLEGKK